MMAQMHNNTVRRVMSQLCCLYLHFLRWNISCLFWKWQLTSY